MAAPPLTEAAGSVPAPAGRSPWRPAGGRLRRDPAALAGLAIIALFVLLALAAPLLTALNGHGPNEFHPEKIDKALAGAPRGAFGGIDGDFWLGVEPGTGRDVFSRMVYGARISLLISVAATCVATAAGTALGLTAGFAGGRVDAAISRVMDLVLSFPQLIFMIALVSVLPEGNRTLELVFVMGFFGWPYIGRIVRGQTLSLRHREFVEAARATGMPRHRIVFREVMPNLLAPVLVYATLTIPVNIGTEAALSFLGIGVRPPNASWGQMMAKAIDWYQVDPTFFVVPGVCLLLTVLAFTLLGDAFRDALDPKGAGR
ncbi:peptide/nickel transport system permease protein [Actinomadura luteofluorescens]|uniref:Peptide/nickel transport system permease protein n=1 Tax=Actinomadura luteofluorescens TaxID=46163 RepID=A0A7Y9EMM9_9ACTN|nr:ABC transporter permease [Actinomadura luteofluorescens]NYD50446.1 peptide/nickel transport system permease protein [Actinomadura luteofluorescens]